jgi:hypothetical protein
MNWEPDSDAVWELKMRISSGLMRQGPGFLNSKEYQELSRMLKEIRDKEAQGGA